MQTFNKILIANRGEIAVRIIKTLKALEIQSITVYSGKDSNALYKSMSDEAYFLEGETLADTYLNIGKIIDVAIQSGADAIHPGYGFLSENAEFARKVSEAGLNFIGPTAGVISLMGDKLQARNAAVDSGLPLIEGYEGKAEDILKHRSELEFPVIIKAAAGGGGKAMRIVNTPDEFTDALEVTRREAKNYFGDDNLYVEKYFEKGRHIEIQVLADHYGNVLIAGERECSVQRRHQKVIEETPSTFLSEETRDKMYAASRKLVKDIKYENAGTIEFLVDTMQGFYFLEMNTRIQVEHPVTEEAYGIDIVEEQIKIAAGNDIELKQHQLIPARHAIEARIYAENPLKEFLPSPGKIHLYSEPVLPGLRIDSGLEKPGDIFPDFDPMISKVIATGSDRETAIFKLREALREYSLAGTSTNREFLLSMLYDHEFLKNDISTTWLEKKLPKLLEQQQKFRAEISPEKAISAWLLWSLNRNSKGKENTWNQIGYWRHIITKTVVFNEIQVEITVLEKKKNTIIIEIDNKAFNIELKYFSEDKVSFLFNGERVTARAVLRRDVEDIVLIHGYEFRLKPLDYLPGKPFLKNMSHTDSSGPKVIRSPLHGRIVKLNAILNQKINKGELLFTLDAMKIENKVVSPFTGLIKKIHIIEGQQVSYDQEILIIE